MEPSARVRSTLLSKALALPIARDDDFFGPHRPPPGADPQHLRIIKDTSLRSRLILAGLAEGLQSPKGPQKIPSIVRIYPDAGAPRPDGARSAPRRSEPPARSAFGLPSVEELKALVVRVENVETEVAAEMQGRLNADIARLKSEIGTLEGEEFERAFRALDAALQERRDAAKGVREETFRRIEADASFAPRAYLRLISREPRALE